VPRVRSQRNSDRERGISGTSSSPAARSAAIVVPASAPLSVKEAWMSRAPSSAAIVATWPGGA
jgi:hypothetical protein